ncbi:Cysteine-rich secretory protein [Zostera marina]|uniref:Cysteine-rich secretory protein n=1 Tax=Zostera marina TaxID=29655 RepID=A0A0K9P6S1_ZOSMR|nr:Cysteine-rich secretory protein [Zostera marina]
MARYPKLSLAFLCVMVAMAFVMAQRSEAQITPKSFLHPHTIARYMVGVHSLVWDTTIAASAQQYINTMKGDCKLKNSNFTYGENLFWESYGGRHNAVDSWVEGKKWYNHTSNSCIDGKNCNSYTQVVWKNSVKLGCGSVTCDKGRGRLVICYYDPPGNYVGESPY